MGVLTGDSVAILNVVSCSMLIFFTGGVDKAYTSRVRCM
ncbi:hypothetical protein D777_01715 [Marinobacter nitratireducens]|uniref:Uncharacterized protein n=1 Tax=Marinobacter nitratireducens TaxID=1137280 RepID=A0A072N1H3_9GAMM|nr:hypothetical protein D777_01715 [Marinobacter nitratireducens]